MTSLLVLWQMTLCKLQRTVYHIEGARDTFAFHCGYSAYTAKEGSGFSFIQISIIPTEGWEHTRFVASSLCSLKTAFFFSRAAPGN